MKLFKRPVAKKKLPQKLPQIPFNYADDVCPISHIPVAELDEPVLLRVENRIYEREFLVNHIIYTIKNSPDSNIYTTPVNSIKISLSQALKRKFLESQKPNNEENEVIQGERLRANLDRARQYSSFEEILARYEEILTTAVRLTQKLKGVFLFLMGMNMLYSFFQNKAPENDRSTEFASKYMLFIYCATNVSIIGLIAIHAYNFLSQKSQELSSENDLFQKISKDEIAEMVKNKNGSPVAFERK